MAQDGALLTIVKGVSVTLPITTADRRSWSVTLDWGVIEKLEGRTAVSAADAETVVMRNMHFIEFAALRAIGRGQFIGAVVRLAPGDIRF